MSDLRKAAEMAAIDLEEFISWHGIRDSNDKLMPAHNQTPEIKSAIESLDALRQALAQPEQEPEWIDDGFGTMWQKCGKKDCGKFVVKIGKVDCWNGDCPEAKEKNT